MFVSWQSIPYLFKYFSLDQSGGPTDRPTLPSLEQKQNVEGLVLTNRTFFFVTAVIVVGLPDTLLATILRLRAVALTHPTFASTSACH